MSSSEILAVFGVMIVMILLLCAGLWLLARENSRLNERIDEISEDFYEEMNDLRERVESKTVDIWKKIREMDEIM